MVIPAAKQRTSSPSRLKYEASHPTVTVRVDQESYEELKALKQRTGQSVAEVLRVGLGKAQAAAKEAYERGYANGGEAGYLIGCDDAQEEYEVVYVCAECEKPHLSITTDEEAAAAAAMMHGAGWHDPGCAAD